MGVTHLDLRKQSSVPLYLNVQIFKNNGFPWDLAAESFLNLEIYQKFGKTKELTHTVTITKPDPNQWHLGIITINTSIDFDNGVDYSVKLVTDSGLVVAVGYLREFENAFFIDEPKPYLFPTGESTIYEDDDDCGCDDCGTIVGVPNNSVLISDIVDELLNP